MLNSQFYSNPVITLHWKNNVIKQPLQRLTLHFNITSWKQEYIEKQKKVNTKCVLRAILLFQSSLKTLQCNNAYFYNGYVYTRKGSDGEGLTTQKLLVLTQCVLRCTKPIKGSNWNVTADDGFSSIELVDELAKQKLTFVGTTKKNKREIPSEFQPQKIENLRLLCLVLRTKKLCAHTCQRRIKL